MRGKASLLSIYSCLMPLFDAFFSTGKRRERWWQREEKCCWRITTKSISLLNELFAPRPLVDAGLQMWTKTTTTTAIYAELCACACIMCACERGCARVKKYTCKTDACRAVALKRVVDNFWQCWNTFYATTWNIAECHIWSIHSPDNSLVSQAQTQTQTQTLCN